jgi:DNA-binding protein YbaB
MAGRGQVGGRAVVDAETEVLQQRREAAMNPIESSRTGDAARLGELEELDREVRRIQQAVKESTGTAESPDGLIEATVTVYGELADLVVDPRVYREGDADALAEQIKATVNEARREAQSAVRRDLARYFRPGTDGADLDVADFAFQPLRSTFDAHGKGRH